MKEVVSLCLDIEHGWLNDQSLINFFIRQWTVGQWRTARPDFPQRYSKRINIWMNRGIILKEKDSNSMRICCWMFCDSIENNYRQRFRCNPTQWNHVYVIIWPIFVLILSEGDCTIGQFDRIIRIEKNITCRHVAMNKFWVREILKCIGQLISKENIHSRNKVEHDDNDRKENRTIQVFVKYFWKFVSIDDELFKFCR